MHKAIGGIGVLLAVAVGALGETPSLEVGRVIPAAELVAADGSRRSVSAIDGPAVLLFYRGLW